MRGPRVRHSLIPAIPSHILPPSTLPYHPFNSTSVQINFSPAQRTIHHLVTSSQRRRPAASRGTPSTSIAAEPFVEEPQELFLNTSSLFSPPPPGRLTVPPCEEDHLVVRQALFQAPSTYGEDRLFTLCSPSSSTEFGFFKPNKVRAESLPWLFALLIFG